jgi:hypothetical protein
MDFDGVAVFLLIDYVFGIVEEASKCFYEGPEQRDPNARDGG